MKRTIPKVKINRKQFEQMLHENDCSYEELGDTTYVGRCESTIRKNVKSGMMPLTTAIGISAYLDIDIQTFADLNGFVGVTGKRVSSPEYFMNNLRDNYQNFFTKRFNKEI